MFAAICFLALLAIAVLVWIAVVLSVVASRLGDERDMVTNKLQWIFESIAAIRRDWKERGDADESLPDVGGFSDEFKSKMTMILHDD